MKRYLKPHVHAAAVDEDLVLLDVAADCYLCLPGAGEAWRQGGGAADALLARLRAAGLARDVVQDTPRPALPATPSTRLPSGLRSSPRPADQWRLAQALLDLGLHYRARSFQHILGYVAAHKAPPGAASDREMLQRHCEIFLRAVPWLPAPGKCLARSFLLLRYLQRSGQDATWVFGVRTWPFQAHCWVQQGEIALEDFPERLVAYTPILAI